MLTQFILYGTLLIIVVAIVCAAYDTGYEEGFTRALTDKMEPLGEPDDDQHL